MPPPKERQNIKVQAEKTILAAVRLPDSIYDPDDPFGELEELAKQAGAEVVGTLEQFRQKPEAGTYLGSGKLDELRALCDAMDATAIIFDHDLSPKQIAKIEERTERKVLDRSELILDIFASRATTHEAKLQVELAQLEYTYPRLRAMWSHLERIVGSGGIGGVGTRGPGEQQLEIDRRIVQRKKILLQRELEQIQSRKRRAVQKRNTEHFTIGLVGYTNAGKSTLFNTLTTGGAYADDRVFATLMTRTRAWDLGGGTETMLSDTVGFVRELPHHLVASFKATLEEATHADLLLVVLDVSDPAAELHWRTVNRTLDELFEEVERAEHAGEHWTPPPRVLLLNKADALNSNAELLVWTQNVPGSIPLCSLPGEDGLPRTGAAALLARVRGEMQGGTRELLITLPLHESKAIHTIESRGDVLDREYHADRVTLRAKLGLRELDRLRHAGTELDVRTASGEPLPPVVQDTGW